MKMRGVFRFAGLFVTSMLLTNLFMSPVALAKANGERPFPVSRGKAPETSPSVVDGGSPETPKISNAPVKPDQAKDKGNVAVNNQKKPKGKPENANKVNASSRAAKLARLSTVIQANEDVAAQQSTQPVGNNGTIKIDGREFDRHPNNEPHPGCIFQVDFYNFDKGDFNANVTFQAQPPSGTGTVLTDVVFVGGDAAGGGDDDIDAQRTYNLSGRLGGLTRHPKQGYHIKVTADLPSVPGVGKHKVFWVDCPPPVIRTDNPTDDNGNGGGRGLVRLERGQVLGAATGPGVLPDTGVIGDDQSLGTIIGIMMFVLAVAWLSKRLKYSYSEDYAAGVARQRITTLLPRLRQGLATMAIGAALAFMPLLQSASFGPQKVSAQTTPELTAQTDIVEEIKGKPVRVIIPSLGIDLPVVDGSYSADSNTWSVSDSAANYATNTVLTNNIAGQTLIYGHNTKRIFQAVSELQPGDKVHVYTDNNHIFTYQYNTYVIVSPTDTSVLQNLDGEAGLKLMTCDGKRAQNRRLVSLSFIGVQ